jgi:hypothetical protein
MLNVILFIAEYTKLICFVPLMLFLTGYMQITDGIFKSK